MQKSKRSKHKIMKEECTINQKNVKEKTEAEKESGTPGSISGAREENSSWTASGNGGQAFKGNGSSGIG